MLAYRDNNGAWRRWRPGSPLPDGTTPPKNAEDILSAEKLASLGLSPVTRGSVPEGKRAVGWELVDVSGSPVEQPTLADLPPEPTAAEKFTALESENDTVELALRAVISLLADQQGRTDDQAKVAVRTRMQEIADGTRG